MLVGLLCPRCSPRIDRLAEQLPYRRYSVANLTFYALVGRAKQQIGGRRSAWRKNRRSSKELFGKTSYVNYTWKSTIKHEALGEHGRA